MLSAKDVWTIALLAKRCCATGHRLELPKRCAEWTLPTSPTQKTWPRSCRRTQGCHSNCGSRWRTTSGRRNTTSIPWSAALRLESRCGHWLCTWRACRAKNRMVSLLSADPSRCPCTNTSTWSGDAVTCSLAVVLGGALHVIVRCLACLFEALAVRQKPRARLDGTPVTEREAFGAVDHTCELPPWNSLTLTLPTPAAQRRLTNLVRLVVQMSFVVPAPTKLSTTTIVHVPIVTSRWPSKKGWSCTGSLGLYTTTREIRATTAEPCQLRCLGWACSKVTAESRAPTSSMSAHCGVPSGSRATSARHRNPLFSRETHTSPCSVALDSLCFHMGVYKDCGMTVLWKCILADAWKHGTSTQDELVQMSVIHCKEELQVWYRTQSLQHPSILLHKLQDLRPSMLGNPLPQELGTKAGETGTLLEFARDVAKQHVACLGAEGASLVAVGGAACSSARTCGPSEASLPSCALWQASVAHPSGSSCCTSVQDLASRESTVPQHFPWTKSRTAEWRSWQQDAIA